MIPSQLMHLSGRAKTRGEKAVNAVILLRAAVKTRKGQVQELRQKFLDGVQDEDPHAPMYQTEYETAREALRKAEENLGRKEEALGVDQHQELESLAKSEYMRHRMNARSIKLRLRDRLRCRKFEMDPVERAYRRLLNGELLGR